MTRPGEPGVGLVESVDIYPTLAELCGLEPPLGLDGRSFSAILADPTAQGKKFTLGFWAGGRAHSIRTERYRLTEWTSADEPPRTLQVELYDHRADPDETLNVAADHREVVETLSGQLQDSVPLLRKRLQSR
jgi:arylsulfatase A-like enzyme